MRKLNRLILGAVAVVTMGVSLGGCFGHEETWGYGRDGRAYHHRRWHDEEVYQREDGHWYARRNNNWEVRADVVL